MDRRTCWTRGAVYFTASRETEREDANIYNIFLFSPSLFYLDLQPIYNSFYIAYRV